MRTIGITGSALKAIAGMVRNVKRAPAVFLILFGIGLITPGKLDAQETGAKRYLRIQPIFMTDADSGGSYCSKPSDAVWHLFAAATQQIWDQAAVCILWQSPHTLAAGKSGFLDLDGAGYSGSVVNEFNEIVSTPALGQNSDPMVLNMWFPRSMAGGIDGISLQSRNQGRGISYQNGMAVSAAVFSRKSLDVIAHELGHNLGLEHTTFGAGGSENLMTDGLARISPATATDIYPSGKQLDRLTGSLAIQDDVSQIWIARRSPFTVQEVPALCDLVGFGQDKATLSWSYGAPPFLVQIKSGVSNRWMDFLTTTAPAISVFRSGPTAFFRVMSHAPSTVEPFRVILNRDTVQPRPDSEAHGSGVLSINRQTLNIDLVFSGLSTPLVSAEIRGPATSQQIGPTILGLGLSSGAFGTSGTLMGSLLVSAEQLKLITNEMAYLEISTVACPQGEIRGQIVAYEHAALVAIPNLWRDRKVAGKTASARLGSAEIRP